ncbi:MAG: protease PrsW [Peptostreptococcaceae bacterium]|jgi:RsiW-degrading membrane proteinase PrsW (M82 family)|uniref:PrsW family intramembrane metalloprotease n=1 Tax=Acetoanaerobium noterae TaxID=745369 RepID=UPI0028B01BA5|nr:PrsW family glutamic-type intramembrane protease [Acetoanaerobium noterae]MDK2804571.1 protease PrsW [Peptostreptococcaceae bacterium]
MDFKLVILAVAPAITLVLFIYFFDKHDKEPISLLLKVFLFGALAVVPIVYVEDLLMTFNIFPGLASAFYVSFIVAGFTEEFFKRLVVMKIAFKNQHYSEKLDGIVYSVMASLGFATVENIMYVAISFKDDIYVGITRAFLSVPAHMLFGISMGYYLSRSKYASSTYDANKYYKKSLIVPMILHGTFNFILLSNHPLLIIVFIPYLIYLWSVSIKRLKIYQLESKKDSEYENTIDN